jgi:hypothetical protein
MGARASAIRFLEPLPEPSEVIVDGLRGSIVGVQVAGSGVPADERRPDRSVPGPPVFRRREVVDVDEEAAGGERIGEDPAESRASPDPIALVTPEGP